jgi:hypothetical protein
VKARSALALAAGLLAATFATGGCEDILGFGSLKDRPADAGSEPTDGNASSSGSSSGTDSGGSSGSSSGSADSGSSSGGSSGSSSGSMSDAAVCTPLASVPASDVPSYAPVQQMGAACQQGQISAFITACTTATSTSTTCNNWQQDPNNSQCDACILPSDGMGDLLATGGVMVNAQGGFFSQNTPGCIALVDPTHGPACAQQLEPLLQCQYQACANCPIGTGLTCGPIADGPGGACAQYAIPACATDYFPDGGTFNNACSGGTQSEAIQAVLEVICGNGI